MCYSSKLCIHSYEYLPDIIGWNRVMGIEKITRCQVLCGVDLHLCQVGMDIAQNTFHSK